MSGSDELTRRRLLFGAAVVAGGVTLGACSSGGGGNSTGEGPKPSKGPTKRGSAAKPLSPPRQLKESPELAAQVKAGKLPALKDRLPDKPYVIPHYWAQTGKYGGTLRLASGSSNDAAIKEYMYGHSPLRWLNDGLTLGPGLAESWESNADASVWTFHFRKGLKWSDGQPWTTADIMFWWQDMVLDPDFGEGIPDEARSGKGTVAKFEAPDDNTLVITYDAPSPMVPDMIANWVNRGIAATWMEPKHYMKQFHPKYNKSVGKDWTTKFDEKRNTVFNPQTPTMGGWQLATYSEGRATTWKRNPYYYVVDQAGNQLPYLDGLNFRVVDNIETRKLQIQSGQFDQVHGPFNSLTLGDISGLKRSQAKSGMKMLLWDSGSGTGSIFFFNQDYDEPAMRALIRKPEFRQALSLAYDRGEARKSIYFDTGVPTTGGYGPKTREFHRGDGPGMYKQWRESWVKFDPERAKSMLDKLGVVDKDGDGKREKPDGSKLVVRLNYPADIDTTGEHMKKNQLLKKSWDAIGIDTRLSPVSPTSFGDQWAQGKLMTTTAWETSTMSVAADMLWLMPMEPSRWASLQGQYYALRGTPDEKKQLDVDPYKRTPPRAAPEPGGPVDRLWKLADQVRVEVDQTKRDKLVWDMIRIHIEQGPFFMGVVANYPQIVLVKDGLRNVPAKEQTALGGLVNDWHHPTPAAYDPEAWFWDDPKAHT
ncbi:peptide/nickel transport system substrate-binding protein [Actinopolymorpha cephalotaxi]|uniref:Peptide/nickel transport system substrate-binding protein n=1 Tax=Actinopolymorpha cephalotaxi TaxID=504797 RepID=A0A1I2SAC6_9ACTN|nr:ABC transporter substrate-binding protein [Actinopolymorpha cephalotaxi]NYH83880.1 peptide/nickel transport system substrate-binding protein [Actinopolymorpha cephalotaxi]SFG47006.1 peptide/nickel transport system substrate-binding protein [Actinopolymorpha cephalotaxi]